MKSLAKLKKPLIFTLIVLFAVNVFFGYKYRVIYVQGDSMEPSYENGDWIVMEKASSLGAEWSPDKYDIILIREKDGTRLCKRVLGLPGDKVEIREGVIYLNKLELKDPFGYGKIGYYLVDEDDNNLKYWSGPDKGENVYQLMSQKEKTVPKEASGLSETIGDTLGSVCF